MDKNPDNVLIKCRQNLLNKMLDFNIIVTMIMGDSVNDKSK
jgi:hypothetical protein